MALNRLGAAPKNFGVTKNLAGVALNERPEKPGVAPNAPAPKAACLQELSERGILP